MGLSDALSKFAFTLGRLDRTERIARVASEMCDDAAAEGVTTLEIRFGPQLHGKLPIASVLDAAIEGAGGRAGLILCGLYGESPDQIGHLVDLAIARPAVVGVDLAGGPAPGNRYGMRDYAEVYQRAAANGLGVTVHAGEGRPPGEIRDAIERLGATRIGHGTTLLEDAAVLDLVLERGITVEACVTSNWHVGAIPAIEAHPLARWLELGVKACICTDNTLLSQVNAPTEHARVMSIPGMSAALLKQAVANGHAGAFGGNVVYR